ncbi:MAG: endonuclease/exonuclease/phosphatase family protein [Chloroflexota bacterium]
MTPPSRPTRLRVVSWNIRRGGRRRRALLARVLHDLAPDLTLLQEAIDPEVVASLAEAADAVVVAATPGRSVAVLARERIGPVDVRRHAMPGARDVVEAVFPDLELRVVAVHLSAGLSGRPERRRVAEVDRLLAIAEPPPGPDRTMIAGDLNAIAPGELPVVSRLPMWIRFALRVDGGIGTAAVGRVLAAGYTDAFRHLDPDDPGATMPALAPTVRLDYLMLGRGLVPGIAGCRVGVGEPSLLAAASDHLPVALDLDLAPVAAVVA